MDGQEDGRLRDYTRRDVRREKEKTERKNGEAGNETPGWERKKGNEEIFALSRACHAVPHEKIFFLSPFLSSFFPFSISLRLSFSSSKSGYTSRAEYELCMRKNVKLYDVYTGRVSASRRNPQSRIYYTLFN